MNKKGIPEAMVTAVMSLYKGAQTKVKVGTHLCEEFEVNVGVHQGSVLSPLLFAKCSRCCYERDKRGHVTGNIVRG